MSGTVFFGSLFATWIFATVWQARQELRLVSISTRKERGNA